MTRYYGGFGPDDYDGDEPDGRALADALPRTDPNGLVTPARARYSRPWSATDGRDVPGKVADPEAAAPLKDLLDMAACGQEPSRAELNALTFSGELSEYRVNTLRTEIRHECARIARTFRTGAQADARGAARVALGEFAGNLAAERSADEYTGYDGRKLAEMIPRSGVPTRDLPPRS